jgi:hypothetical protein
MFLFHALEGKKKFAKHIQKLFLVQTLVKFTLKEIRKTFPELFQGEKEILRDGMTIFP